MSKNGMVTDELKKYDSFVIYGAQVIAVGAWKAIEGLTGRRPECFAVGKKEGNPEEIDGIPVRPIEEVAGDTFIVVGVTELIQKEVLPYLSENGYRNVFPLTQHEEHLLMSAYYDRMGMFPCVGNESVDSVELTDQDFFLYEVCNDRDKPISAHPALFPYERTIQAGAALTDHRISDITDDTGENISAKNRMYCEMSAVYWIWKNDHHDWVGIEHYRRHLLVKPEMLKEDVDVILPLPYICWPDESAQFRRFVSEDVQNALIRALKELHPVEFQDYEKILYGDYQYTYNMLCVRWQVFDDYCRWFFEITEYMEENMSKEVPELVETRAFSYVAEVLTNLYFMYHRKDLRIRHVEKEIYT